MKKILFCLMALLCVMGVSAQARSITAEVPLKYQSAVNITIDGQSFDLMPQQVIVQEMDSNHVKVCVLHNRGQASTTIPIPYNFVLDVAKFAWDCAYKTKLISNEEYLQGLAVYNKQYPSKDSISPCRLRNYIRILLKIMSIHGSTIIISKNFFSIISPPHVVKHGRLYY